MCAICTIMRAWHDIVQVTPSTEEGRHGLSVQSFPEKGPLEILLACICHEPLSGALQLGRLRLPCYSLRLKAAPLGGWTGYLSGSWADTAQDRTCGMPPYPPWPSQAQGMLARARCHWGEGSLLHLPLPSLYAVQEPWGHAKDTLILFYFLFLL